MTYSPKKPTTATVEANRSAVERYDMAARRDFADTDQGLIAPIPGERVLDPDGKVLFDLSAYDYVTEEAPAPDTVNPSLWRQSQLITKGGLFKVTDGLYQVRDNDIGNLTVVEGDDGLIVIDCTTGVENA